MKYHSMKYSCLSIALILSWLMLVVINISGEPLSDEAEKLGARYNYEKVEYQVDQDGFTINYRSKLTVLNPRGDEMASFAAQEGRWSKLKRVKLSVFDASGKLLYDRNKKDLIKVCGYDGASLYADICNYSAELKAPTYPYTIEIEYTKDSKTLFGWGSLPLQGSVPVDQIEISVNISNKVPFRWKGYGLTLTPEIVHDGSRTKYLWQTGRLEALEDIDYTPSGINEPAHIRFVADKFRLEGKEYRADNWSVVGDFYHQLAEDRYGSTYPPTAFLSNDQQHDSMKSIYNAVINNNRYVSIQIGIGGWQPFSAKLTESRGYGDCKALTTLLISRLRSAGIEAYPALLNTRSARTTDLAFSSLSFNHVITMALIDSDTIWMDPTCNLCQLGDLPRGDEGMAGLVVTESGGVLKRIPTSNYQENHESRETTVNINADRSISFESQITLTGEKARYLRYLLPRKTDDEALLYLRGMFPKSLRRFGLSSYSVENIESIDLPLIINIEGNCSKPVERIKNQLYCKPMFLDQRAGYEIVAVNERSVPINLYYPKSIRHQLTINYAAELNINQIDLPDSLNLATSFGELKFSTTLDENSVRIGYLKNYNSFQVETEQFDEYKQWKRALKKITGAYITLYQ